MNTIKKIFFLCLLITGSILSYAQEGVQVTYLKAEPFQDAALRYQGISNFRIRITGRFSGKGPGKLTLYTCRNGAFSSEELRTYVPAADTLEFYLFAPRESEGDARLAVASSDSGDSMGFATLPDATSMHILMETYSGRELFVTDEIPLGAYTMGIVSEREYQGQKGMWIDYCGLRDAHVHPSQWYEKYGIDNYIYFTVQFK